MTGAKQLALSFAATGKREAVPTIARNQATPRDGDHRRRPGNEVRLFSGGLHHLSCLHHTRRPLDGHSTEISVVGCEGVVGISVLLGTASTSTQAIVESPGTVYRLAVTDFKRAVKNDADMRMLMLLYTQTLLTQMAQTAVCNRHHTVEQQVCRWLLLCLDRLPTNELTMTQELIANMLGVRREGVTQAAGKLQKVGIIRYRRGRITVLDFPRLKALCCECYAVIKQENDRLGLTCDWCDSQKKSTQHMANDIK